MSVSVEKVASNERSGSSNQWGDAVDRAKAKDAGIEWERPHGDDRSAQEIIDSSPLLKNLGNQSGVKDKLRDRVGDFEKDPDAAYRAVQVLDHVEQFDEGGKRLVGGDIGNSRVDGFTKGGDAKHGTEAGRLQDFGKYGFENLKGELKHIDAASENKENREKAEALGIQWERPENDKRSAQDIIDSSPLLKNLGNQSHVKDMLKEQVGDFERDPDAAFRATQVLDHVVRFDENGQRMAGTDVNNSRIDGFTKGGEAKHGTEAGRLQDFGKGGFDSLKGTLTHASSVGGDTQARKDAEAAGIVWELPEGDKRSAQDIIDANPLLKNLGNQSGVKDALKERVGDFDTDANAAFRASQVLDRVVGYNEKGDVLSGADVANSSVDGFTKGGEAKHGTEAGRLQDFGKHGFSQLAKPQASNDIASYKDYLKANPDADAGSKQVAQYAAILEQKYDSIRGKTGAGDALTAQNLKDYKNANPQLSQQEKEALDFFSQPGAFRQLDTASASLGGGADGKANKADISAWLSKQAPKDATGLTTLMQSVVSGNITGQVDTSKLGEDVFVHPEKYSAEQKAAVLLDLQNAQKLVVDGANAGMWSTDYGKVAIANRSGAYWEPEKLLQDINTHISQLQNDPDTATFIKDKGDEGLKNLFEANPGLKEAVGKTYDDEIKSGKALDKAWDAATKDGKTDQTAALTSYYATAQSMQTMLGTHDAAQIQGGVGKSKHAEALKTFYKDQLATGDRMRELLKTQTPEQAAASYSMEIALYNATLDPTFTAPFDKQVNDNFSTVTQENLFKGSSFEDIKKAYGKDGGDQLDEDKIRKLIDQMRTESPELLMNADGTMATTDQVLSGFRGNWDLLRQGTKALDKFGHLSDFDPSGDAKGAYGSGALHAVSGLFLAGVTISRGAQSGGKLTDRNIVDIATGSVQTATVLTEGGAKGYQTYMADALKKGKDLIKDMNNAGLAGDLLNKVEANVNKGENYVKVSKNFEEAAKGIGGLAGIAAGAYGIFDGVQAIRRGDNLSGGFSITAGSLGVLAGTASAAEGTLGLLGAQLPRFLPALAGTAGVLGFLGAGVAVLGALIPGLVKEGQQQAQQDSFGSVLGDAIERYGIDGVKDGTIADIATKDWPGGEQWTS
ncbi:MULTISPECIES: type III effector HrpK domain-containing protein [unclassified Pseudomonas]|uniref:type III effector HrpK domain-containing protein n=1 Tax=unclassified Pseudomonas TaxID=196821 RepID=UPI000BD8D15D|nr:MULTISPECIES: type III effector HrpK domain-containing protein [unclassified Pseudomonas]PVZ12283.1 type III secretion system (T3SS) translocator HrpF [Pseudomonas sp. URIL14HWK12:I12]PVZ23565.1 type III secretion system (T3SS) translocator HrpF [Pseudomonas sp. URIL14HWK12:I10]PVZ32895.1 type III secretion system (T3SS) translocator HrpF [Pseudomonas sp. URIL14HWK12:I11]SNZ18763.1 Type III secretion system translocator protein, HrpF [Pseudomonas sp. URIL14HWK12:I9]